MTNKEKEQYLSDMMIFMSQPFLCELSRRNDFLKKMPRILYKYRSFDEYSFEMLEDSYAYLAPVKDLDDPFDCLTYPGIEGNDDNDQNSVGLAMIDYVMDVVCNLGNVKINKRETKKMVLASYENGEFNEIKAQAAVERYARIPPEHKEILMFVLRNLDNTTKTIIESQSIKDLSTMTLNPGNTIGICSLSTKRDNKAMWSLYSNKYKGYCIEYEIPNDKGIRFNLCPVIYKKNEDNNYLRKLVKLAIANCIRVFSEGMLNRGVGCLNELYCTKDRDWSYQDEWRLIGNAGYHCKKLKVKAIYLGFMAEIKHIDEIKRIALEKGFNVYLMNAPRGQKKITYTQLI